MVKKSSRLIVLLLALILNSCAEEVERPKISAREAIRATIPSVDLKRGERKEVQIKISIAEGYHVNSTPPSFSYLMPTEVVIPEIDGVKIETPLYPDGRLKKLSFAEKELSIYEGDVEVRVPVEASQEASEGRRQVKAKLKVQACDDQACFPPHTIDLPFEINIRG
jgi:thiol:disulfide interchange protein